MLIEIGLLFCVVIRSLYLYLLENRRGINDFNNVFLFFLLRFFIAFDKEYCLESEEKYSEAQVYMHSLIFDYY